MSNILKFPRKELILPTRFTVGMKGYLRVQIRRPDGRCRWDSGWFPNKILDSGRNNMATQTSWLTHCQVGTDSTPPTALDTQLLGRVAGTSTIEAQTSGTESSSPYFGWERTTYRFPVGAGQGGQNLSEAGVGWGSTGSTLVSRALIVDPDTQLPTTITPLSDEILDITYEMRYYPPLVDVTNSVTLNSVNYDTTTRAAEVTGAGWSDSIGSKIQHEAPFASDWAAYDGNLGTITQSPSGNTANIDSTSGISTLAYSNNSYEVVMEASCGSTGWNLGAGLRSVRVRTSAGWFQTQFDSNPGGNTVPKSVSNTMILQWTLGWTEKV